VNTSASGLQQPLMVYIAGYGRSGSTLLDMILGSHEDIIGTGELTFLFNEVLAGRPCACGQPLVDCSLWGPVLERVRKSGFTWHEAAAITRDSDGLLSRHPDPAGYATLWTELITALRDESGRSVVVDSSKSARRTVRRTRMLRAHTPNSLRTIHLVRDPADVMRSVERGTNTSLEAGVEGGTRLGVLRSLLGWIVANTLVEFVRRRSREPLLLVRYEDLVGDPRATLGRVGAFIGCDLSAVASQVTAGEIPAGHGVGGNRMRRGPAVRLQAPDRSGSPPTPPYVRLLALLVWPLRRRYGYRETRDVSGAA